MDDKNEVTFTLTLAADQLDPGLVASTLRDLNMLLRDIEHQVRGVARSTVRWTWGQAEQPLEFVASVNGASKDELDEIVAEARLGFAVAQAAADSDDPSLEWPDTFGPNAKRSIQRILKRLEKLESITVATEDTQPLMIESAFIGEKVVAGRKVNREVVRSSVEGLLDLIAHRGQLRATITEDRTGRVIRCVVPDAMLEELKELFDKRVVAEGFMTYRPDGTPISMSRVCRIVEQPRVRSLAEFIGLAPDLTGGHTPDEFLERLRHSG